MLFFKQEIHIKKEKKEKERTYLCRDVDVYIIFSFKHQFLPCSFKVMGTFMSELGFKLDIFCSRTDVLNHLKIFKISIFLFIKRIRLFTYGENTCKNHLKYF